MNAEREVRDQELVTLLQDEGVGQVEIEDTLAAIARLSAATSPAPSKAETLSLIASLASELPSLDEPHRRPTARLHPAHARLLDLLRLVALQASVFRAGFWVGSAVVMSLGLALAVSSASAERAFVLALVGPLLAYLGVTAGFRGDAFGLLEVEFACPVTARQLTLARLLVIVGYQALVGLVGGALLHGTAGQSLLSLTVLWLGPLLLAVGLTLVCSVRVSAARAGVLVYAGWAILVASIWRFGGEGHLASTPLDLLCAAVGVGAILLVVALLPKVLAHRLPVDALSS